jgi:photoactive yellow protein
MTDIETSHSPEGDQTQWETLMNVLGVSSADEVVEAVTSLREQAARFKEQKSVLNEAGFENPERALQAIESMEDQLDELYNEKEATERTGSKTSLREDADTFDQLQALLAREEKLQRELGVSDPDAVVEMVEGLTDQVEDLYLDRDADKSTDSIFSPADAASDSGSPNGSSDDTSGMMNLFEEELGVSDPEAVVAMLDDLTGQLDDLYTERERLAELNLNGADDAIAMVKSMQQQLETLYERQEQMSKHGVDGIDHALSMIENMEAQLSELYEERQESATANGVPNLDEATVRLEKLEAKLSSLTEEKERLKKARDQLKSQFDDLEEQLGTGDPEAISTLVDSMERQLEDVYKDREHPIDTPDAPADEETSLLNDLTLARLDDLDASALDDLSVGVFGLDDEGQVRRANKQALAWPDVTADTPDELQQANFFEDVAPGTNNTLFRGRLDEGPDEEPLDEQFFYTYVGKQDPLTNMLVRLYRAPDQSTRWIVFRIQERY